MNLGFYCGEEDMEFSSFSSGTERAVKTWQVCCINFISLLMFEFEYYETFHIMFCLFMFFLVHTCIDFGFKATIGIREDGIMTVELLDQLYSSDKKSSNASGSSGNAEISKVRSMLVLRLFCFLSIWCLLLLDDIMVYA